MEQKLFWLYTFFVNWINAIIYYIKQMTILFFTIIETEIKS